jgi:hypothetical protein
VALLIVQVMRSLTYIQLIVFINRISSKAFNPSKENALVIKSDVAIYESILCFLRLSNRY